MLPHAERIGKGQADSLLCGTPSSSWEIYSVSGRASGPARGGGGRGDGLARPPLAGRRARMLRLHHLSDSMRPVSVPQKRQDARLNPSRCTTLRTLRHDRPAERAPESRRVRRARPPRVHPDTPQQQRARMRCSAFASQPRARAWMHCSSSVARRSGGCRTRRRGRGGTSGARGAAAAPCAAPPSAPRRACQRRVLAVSAALDCARPLAHRATWDCCMLCPPADARGTDEKGPQVQVGVARRVHRFCRKAGDEGGVTPLDTGRGGSRGPIVHAASHARPACAQPQAWPGGRRAPGARAWSISRRARCARSRSRCASSCSSSASRSRRSAAAATSALTSCARAPGLPCSAAAVRY